MPAGINARQGVTPRTNAETDMSDGNIEMRLTLDVTYILNGEDVESMRHRLLAVAEQAVGEGLLTGGSAAEIEEYSISVQIPPKPLSEEQIADLMLQRIETGDLLLEDLPSRLARYGLMEPSAFVDEMRERMELAADDSN